MRGIEVCAALFAEARTRGVHIECGPRREVRPPAIQLALSACIDVPPVQWWATLTDLERASWADICGAGFAQQEWLRASTPEAIVHPEDLTVWFPTGRMSERNWPALALDIAQVLLFERLGMRGFHLAETCKWRSLMLSVVRGATEIVGCLAGMFVMPTWRFYLDTWMLEDTGGRLVLFGDMQSHEQATVLELS